MSNADRCRRYRIKRHDSDMVRDMVRDMLPEILQAVRQEISTCVRHAMSRHAESSPPIPPLGSPLDSLPNPPLIPPSEIIRSLDNEFDEIYEMYPRHIGKGAARRAYRTARKKATFDEIAAGVRRLAADQQTTEAQFIPHPATWLNGERWLDEALKPNGHAATEHKPTYGRLRDPTEIAKELGLKP